MGVPAGVHVGSQKALEDAPGDASMTQESPRMPFANGKGKEEEEARASMEETRRLASSN